MLKDKLDLSKLVIDFSNIDVSSDTKELKQKIEEVVDADEIFSYYIPNFKLKKLIRSPLRKESTPSFNVFKTDAGKVMYKDFKGDTGDCYTFVQKLLGVGYRTALHIVYSDLDVARRRKQTNLTTQSPFRANIGSNVTNEEILNAIDKEVVAKINNLTTQIIIEAQPYTGFDMDYWKQYGISVETLNNFNVKSCNRVFVGDMSSLPIRSTLVNPMYAYKFGKTPFLDLRYKIYRPFADRTDKWINNCTSSNLQGYDQLPNKGYMLIITKSMKDVMALYEIGVTAVAPQSEGSVIPKPIMDDLANRFTEFMILYDYDSAGIEGATRIQKTDPYCYKMFIEDIKAKDFSDFVYHYGISEAKTMLHNLINRTIGIPIDWHYIVKKEQTIE